MKISKWYRFVGTAMAATALLTLTGCTEGFLRNLWVGFGEGLGAVPGLVLADAISTGLGV